MSFREGTTCNLSARACLALRARRPVRRGTTVRGSRPYPARNVTIVNPTLAGSTTDGLARALAVGLSNRLGQQFVVSNQAGGAGAIGTATVARAAPDGHTLLFGAVYVLSVLPALRPAEVGYRSDSLVPVCQTVSNAMVLVVRPDSRFKSLADLVAAARAEPGKITYGHQGPGSIPNLATEEFLQTANLRINQVPYRGDPAVLTDVLGGQIDVGALVLGSVPGQNVRVLGRFRRRASSDVSGRADREGAGLRCGAGQLRRLCWRRPVRRSMC